MSEIRSATEKGTPADEVQVYDLVVIGSGPGGQKAAVQAVKTGKKVAVLEKHEKVGGGCVHWGTLPSKSLRESAYRWSLSSRSGSELPEMQRLMKRKERVIEKE